jgi:hypothetical protein
MAAVIHFTAQIRVLKRHVDCKGVFCMNDRDFPIEGNDIALMIFVLVGGWLLFFQSGLF